jgi:hypothetical protein
MVGNAVVPPVIAALGGAIVQQAGLGGRPGATADGGGGARVSHLCVCIGSPCLRQCVHGASIERRRRCAREGGARAGGWRRVGGGDRAGIRRARARAPRGRTSQAKCRTIVTLMECAGWFAVAQA